MIHVMDSSVLLAVAKGEPGAEAVMEAVRRIAPSREAQAAAALGAVAQPRIAARPAPETVAMEPDDTITAADAAEAGAVAIERQEAVAKQQAAE